MTCEEFPMPDPVRVRTLAPELSGPEKPFITLRGVTLRRGDTLLLPDTTWEIRTGQNWAILGGNGSGKSVLAGAVRGDIPHVRGELIRHLPEAAGERIGYLSFELQEEILRREDLLDDARSFSGRGQGLTAGELFGIDATGGEADLGFEDFLNIRPLLGRALRVLSNGEIRKVLITRALRSVPNLLILDEPFAGLDAASRKTLSQGISALMAQGTQIILITQRLEEVIAGISHVLLIREGRVFRTGRRAEVLTPDVIKPFSAGPLSLPPLPRPIPAPRREPGAGADLLVEMRNVHVAFGGVKILDRLTWSVRRGEKWAVVGPNGSGKTTLLSLISGDNLQAYANDVRLFGVRRGAGQSIWDIRKRIGLVSPELQLRYRKRIPVRDVVLSGFFDSIGLYQRASAEQTALAHAWLACVGLHDRKERSFPQLSYGEKRLVLIARAMVKSPELLILDEPCQGLDAVNRARVLTLMEEIGRQGATAMVYVTHQESEMIPSIQHILKLGPPPFSPPG